MYKRDAKYEITLTRNLIILIIFLFSFFSVCSRPENLITIVQKELFSPEEFAAKI